jgi:hypothetical protein
LLGDFPSFKIRMICVTFHGKYPLSKTALNNWVFKLNVFNINYGNEIEFLKSEFLKSEYEALENPSL